MRNKKEIEKKFTNKQLVKILKRLADSLVKTGGFRIQIKGEKVYIPKDSEIEIDYEKDKKEEKIEIEIKWKK